MARNHSRTPPPRQLTSNETLESLTHWETAFRTFYKRDDMYRIFFKKDVKWNHLMPNYDLSDEVDGDKRKAEELCEDLQDLLNTLAGYLPHSYLTDKILKCPDENLFETEAICKRHFDLFTNDQNMPN